MRRELLSRVGLSELEGQVYLTLVRNGPLTAREVAELTGTGRARTYPLLYALVERGLVEASAGYGSRFAALPPDQALPNLIARRREELFAEERAAELLVRELSEISADAASELEGVQILRSARLIGERFARLEQEATTSIDVFVKAPFFTPAGTPTEREVLARGVRCRGLYEAAALQSEHIAPYLQRWAAQGEDIRLYPGELPMKLAIFDSRVAVMPLVQPGDRAVLTMVVHHSALGALIEVAFDAYWDRGKPWQHARSAARIHTEPADLVN